MRICLENRIAYYHALQEMCRLIKLRNKSLHSCQQHILILIFYGIFVLNILLML